MKDLPKPEQKTRESSPAEPPRRRIRWLRWLALLLLLAVGLAMLSGWNPPIPNGPVRLVRNTRGQLEQEQQADKSGPGWEAHAGQIQAQNSLTTASSESRSGRARFACDRLLIVNRSEHLLMQRVGARLLDHVKELRGFEQVDYLPDGRQTEPGQVAPDVIVTLELEDIQESGLVASHQLEARIRMQVSNSLRRSSSHYSDGLNPPLVALELGSTLQHRSKTTEIGTPSSRYKLAADDIAKQLGEALTKKLNDLYEKDGPLPPLPDAFYPAYRPPPELPLPDGVAIDMVASYHGLMNANETLWAVETQLEPAELIARTQEALENAGWKTSTVQTDPRHSPHLRMKRDEEVLWIYQEPRTSRLLPDAVVTTGQPDATIAAEATESVWLHYLDRMSRDEVSSAVDVLLESDAPIQTLLCFEHQLDDPQRDKLLQRFQEHPPRSVDAWIVLAELHHHAQRTDAARDALQRAAILLRTVGDEGALRSRITSLAKKWGETLPAKEPPAKDLLEEVGFVELTPDAVLEDFEISLEEPVVFYFTNEKGEIETFAVRVVSASQGRDRKDFQLAFVQAGPNSRSWGSGGNPHGTSLGGLGRVTFQADSIDESPKYRLTVRVHGTGRG